MDDDTKKWLRSVSAQASAAGLDGWAGVCTDAADHITALEAQLKTVLDREAATHARHDAKLDKLEAERDQLAAQVADARMAARQIEADDCDNISHPVCWQRLLAALSDTNDRASALLAVVEAAKAEAELWKRDDEDWNECFERTAEMFYRDTGYLRPGKSLSPLMDCDGMDERRKAAWEEWRSKPQKALRAALERLGVTQ